MKTTKTKFAFPILGKIFKSQQNDITMDLFKCNGRKFKAVIAGTPCEGRIKVENGEVYLCQDERDGADCRDKLGYKYSWVASRNGKINFDASSINVTDFRLGNMSEEEIEAYKDWQVGDKVRDKKDDLDMEIIFRSGELVVCKLANDEATRNFTCEELHRLGYRLVTEVMEEPETVEKSVADIEKELGMKAGTLRIKKD